jgi:exodeoxyribonuclease V alpha subunit
LAEPSKEGRVENIAGLIERVTFFNEDSGFVVLRVKVKGWREPVTVIGSSATANPGEWVTAEGRWVEDREFGRQFRAEKLACTPPTSREGIEKYLGGGLVKGVGPVYAAKLVARFGEGVFDTIETRSAQLEEIEGIGPKRRRRIKEAWESQKVVRNIMLFLHSHGVSTSRAVRIHKTYGDEAVEVVRSNPYRLARDIHGIGFKSADTIAMKTGVPRDSLLRAAAGLAHVLAEATGDGHCAMPEPILVEEAVKLLVVEEGVVRSALDRSLTDRELIRDSVDGEDLIFLPGLLRSEQTVARRILDLSWAPAAHPPIDAGKAAAWCEQKTGRTLAPSQKAALARALESRAMIITGGPGVGKTTLVNAILMVLRAKKVRCLLCAPTGRAARRLAETTGLEAKTIHRLLEVRPGGAGAGRNATNPLECDLLVVDESSMIDVVLMAQLLQALPENASLILVGDVDQLPSVGPGMVLRHLIESGVVPVAALTEVFRQAAGSRIITTAHQINAGAVPEPGGRDPESDFHFVERDDPAAAAATLIEIVRTRIPNRFGLDPIRDVQVLCPMNRGSLGSRELNAALQGALNPPREGEPAVEKFGRTFRLRDKVIQTANNYDKDVFNGDIGRITRIDEVEREVVVEFDQREASYDFGELDELAPAYAITVHKSQGSEFPAVVMPLAMQHYMLLQRNLVYTGVTRGRRLVVLVGERKALSVAVRNNRTARRWSGLLQRLRAGAPGAA